MNWPFVVAASLAGWAVLSVLGGERQRRLDHTAAEQALAAAALLPAPDPAAPTASTALVPGH